MNTFLYRFAQLFYYVLPDRWAERVTYPIDWVRWQFEKFASFVQWLGRILGMDVTRVRIPKEAPV